MKQDRSTTQSKQRNNVRILLALFFIIVVILTAFILWLKPSQHSQNDQHQVTNQTTDKSQTSHTNSSASVGLFDTKHAPKLENKQDNGIVNPFKTGLENIPRSLKGTKVDGDIIIDENQNLVVTVGLRQLFDYFLSLVGEESVQTINSRIEAYILSHTPEPAAGQAVNIYHQYISYLQAISELEQSFGSLQLQDTQSGKFDSNLVKQRRDETRKLRTQYFDDETIKAFFATEDGLENYTLEMMAIQNDKTLSPEQKQQSNDLIINRMTEYEDRQAFQSHQKQQATINQLIQRTNELNKQGASKNQLYDMRVQLVGETAATRLAKVDEEDENFDLRFTQYQKRKQQFNKSSDNYQQKISEIEQSLFNEAEIKRLSAYQAIKQDEITTD